MLAFKTVFFVGGKLLTIEVYNPISLDWIIKSTRHWLISFIHVDL